MFIKKDLRPIPEILRDPDDTRERLLLGRRDNEFNGNVKRLCQPKNVERLENLRTLSLYQNKLTELEGIGNFRSLLNLTEVNLGKNDLSSLPEEFSSLTQVKSLWLEDNLFDHFPRQLFELVNLENLRISNNQLSSIPGDISILAKLHTLAIDNNKLVSLPERIAQLAALTTLQIRGNELESLPDEIGDLAALVCLCISSNKLVSLPAALGRLQNLETLYANGNNIKDVPEEIGVMPKLKKINLANNDIEQLPAALCEQWAAFLTQEDGTPASTPREGVDKQVVLLQGNPILTNTLAISESQFTQNSPSGKKQRT
jgi:Leucine-rich repeat (LRR) protein